MDVGERWRSRAHRRGVKSVRVTIYVARLSETLQEQFITDIRAIFRGEGSKLYYDTENFIYD